jgi:hypothetical protein
MPIYDFFESLPASHGGDFGPDLPLVSPPVLADGRT